MRLFGFSILLFFTQILYAENENRLREVLMAAACSADATALCAIADDHGVISLNNDYSLKVDREVMIRFYGERKLDRQLWQQLFYMNNDHQRYYAVKAEIAQLNATTKETEKRDVTAVFTNAYNEQNTTRFRSGQVLLLRYSVNFPFDGKVPSWRFQSDFPVEHTTLDIDQPEVLRLQMNLLGAFVPDEQDHNTSMSSIRLSNKPNAMNIQHHHWSFTHVPAWKREPWADASPEVYAQMHLAVLSMKKDGIERSEFSERMADKIIEQLSTHAAFMGRLFPEFDLRKDFDNRLQSVEDSLFRMARIYDLVRRHCQFTGRDSLFSSQPLQRLWSDKKGNATDINLLLIKLLQRYGYDVAPLLVAKRSFSTVDTLNFAIDDFNRSVALVRFQGRQFVLDASNRSVDFPMTNPELLNTYGLLVGMEEQRWIWITDTAARYKNETILLGHLSGDSVFRTNVYVNSYAYSKAERLARLERDSVKGLQRFYFSKNARELKLKHFIAANEYVDTLPLAQEFDVQLGLDRKENLVGVHATLYTAPDSLFAIEANRLLPVNFGYNQTYSLVSQFSFPSNYEVFLMPNNLAFSAFNGLLTFQREFHKTDDGFSQRLWLRLDKSYFDLKESNELVRFLKKVQPLLEQQVLLKRLN